MVNNFPAPAVKLVLCTNDVHAFHIAPRPQCRYEREEMGNDWATPEMSTTLGFMLKYEPC